MEKKPLSEEEKERNRMKYEIAEELGLLDKVEQMGWKSLTSRESGQIGGILSRRRRKERAMNYSKEKENV